MPDNEPNNRFDLSGTWARSVGGRDIGFVNVPDAFPPGGASLLERSLRLPVGDAG